MAPEVGEHSAEILRGLGYSEEAITAMVERGVTMAPQKNTVELSK
jgi:crotonobetainyl-CoA:carnitine CoA-transferase CaiB-like acyl-CoA transferase